MSLSLKIDNQFIALPDSTEISIEASNPIFSDAGAKTYLFEIPVESLRYIIGNADEIYGESLYDVLEGKRTDIYIDGVQFFSGVVNLEDEISIEDGKIAVSIASGNLEFVQMIEGMNCRDVELKDENIEIGYVYDFAKVLYEISEYTANYPYINSIEISNNDLTFYFPENYIAVDNANIEKSYSDGAPFCNIRRCINTHNTTVAADYIKSHEKDNPPRVKLMGGDEKGSVLCLEFNSMRSAPCFYVLYFLECLFRKLGLDFDLSILTDIEDANRLAFVNTACKVKRIGEAEAVTIDDENKPYPGFGRRFDEPYWVYESDKVFTINRMQLHRQKVAATSENFPDKPVSDVIDAVQGIFNVRFLSNRNGISIVSVPDILRSTECQHIHSEIFEAHKVENRTLGFKMTYNGDKEDTHFDFDGYTKVETKNQYGEIIKKVSANDPTVYVDARNGNTYVTKVYKEAVENGEEKNLNPSLFEVGGFASVFYGDCSNEQYVEVVELPFSPIINNDTNARENIDKVEESGLLTNIDQSIENRYALLVDVGEDPTWTSIKETVVLKYRQNNRMDFFKKESVFAVAFYDYNPEEKIESDFMLGIMRGPGSDSEPETFAQNFDGEGNYRVAFTAANYAFTSDSIDNCNRDFDYNGTAEGVGPDELKGRFSLKLRAGKYDKDGNPIKDADGKPIVIQDKSRAERGLYDTFWKEYAYFTVNKKILRLTCGMEIADIINLDWTKRYKIGEWTGFIANYSFNVNKDGMSEVELEMYYL